MLPPRTAENPISFSGRFALLSLLSKTYSYSPPRASLTESPRASAVPLGASSFSLWCFSTISISKPAGFKIAAASFKSFINILMPRDMLADFRTAVFSDSFFTISSCSSESPVVQSTQGISFSMHQESRPSMAAATLKSITTSAFTSHSLIFLNTGKGFFPSSEASTPAAIAISLSSSINPAMVFPILPLHPCKIIFVMKPAFLPARKPSFLFTEFRIPSLPFQASPHFPPPSP